jgi:hypothetical protein
MALPIIAPAAAPPRMPAPTAQPTQSAFAGAGATMAAMTKADSPDAINDLCMCSPSQTLGSDPNLDCAEMPPTPRIPSNSHKSVNVPFPSTDHGGAKRRSGMASRHRRASNITERRGSRPAPGKSRGQSRPRHQDANPQTDHPGRGSGFRS